MVSEKDNGLQCDFCDVWTHAACEGITEDVYKVLSRCEGAHWFCEKCNIGVIKMLKAVGQLDERTGRLDEDMKTKQKETESEITKVKQGIAKLEDGMGRMKTQIDASLVAMSTDVEQLHERMKDTVSEVNKSMQDSMFNDTDNESTWAQLASRQVDKKLEQTTGEVEKVNKDLEDSRTP